MWISGVFAVVSWGQGVGDEYSKGTTARDKKPLLRRKYFLEGAKTNGFGVFGRGGGKNNEEETAELAVSELFSDAEAGENFSQ